MELKFRNASCVAVGSFNIYIVQPAWLIEVGILAADLENVGIEVNLAEPGFRIRCPGDEMIWSVQPTRITLETKRASTDCGESMALVLKNLPHTPVQAIGCNARYEAPLDADEADRFFAGLPRISTSLGADKSVTQRTQHVGITEAHHVFNLSIVENRDVLQLSVNVHIAVGGKKSPFSQQVAADFLKLLRTAEELASSIFRVTINNDTSDN